MTHGPDAGPGPARARPLRIALIAGEASGDLLGASLAESLRTLRPEVELVGVAGPKMRASGVQAWYDCEALAVMGLVEVLRHLPRLLRLRRTLRSRLLHWQPDLVVGIDAPDFNLGLERWLKQRGIRTAHYVSPSVWAWRESRVLRIARSADRILCLFPFEPAIYQRHGVDARFVGHPLATQFSEQPDRDAARERLGLPVSGHWLGLLPGSRLGEIRRLGGDFLDAAALFRRRHPEFALLVPMTGPATRQAFERGLAERLARAAENGSEQCPGRAELAAVQGNLRIVEGQSHDVMIASDLLLLASGTAALEAMLAKRPMVVGYRIAALTHWLVRRLGLLKVDRYSLPNVLAGEALVSECMQDACTGPNLARHLHALWADDAARRDLQSRYLALHRQLLPPEEHAAARALDELLTGAP